CHNTPKVPLCHRGRISERCSSDEQRLASNRPDWTSRGWVTKLSKTKNPAPRKGRGKPAVPPLLTGRTPVHSARDNGRTRSGLDRKIFTPTARVRVRVDVHHRIHTVHRLAAGTETLLLT